ncbi:MAG TPA: hypothetical protein VNU97_07720 [Rhizomicrobium sp.]|jgi:hypothetical protein|nr:hypothetical protein [Rhizomicrobium sp.]
MSDPVAPEKVKKERSPVFPFIPLGKAVERTKALFANHKLQPARVAAVAVSWDYAAKSSGLFQTVAALKQFGLVEDVGSGDDRKIQITDLGRRIVQDERPGARESALKEAAKSPRLIAEYLPIWLPERPSDSHCLSELEIDRGFNSAGAKQFLYVFDQTVAYAKLGADDNMSSDLSASEGHTEKDMGTTTAGHQDQIGKPGFPGFGMLQAKPLAQRLKVELTAQSVGVSAMLTSASEVDTLIKILEANKALLPEKGSDN